MSDKVRRLAGSSPPNQLEGQRRLAGENSLTQVAEPRLAGVVQLNLPTQELVIDRPTFGPLADPESLATRGLRVHAARKRSVIDRHPPMVGARAMLSIDFYDMVSKQAVSPQNVRVEIDHVGTHGTETISMTENSGRIGYYTCSFIPSLSGDWNARAKYGDGDEAIDTIRFYVLSAQ